MQYSNSLFREEAIEGQHRDKLGNALRLPSPQHLVVVCLLLFVTGSFIYLLITHTYTNKVSVVGWLVAEKASVDIYPIEQNSLLGDIPVTSNQIVSKGEVLAHLVRPNSQLSGETAHHKQLDSIKRQLSLLNQQTELNSRQYQQNLLQNKQLMGNLNAQLTTSKKRLSHLESLLSLHRAQENELYSLYQLGSVSKTVYQQSQEKGLQLKVQVSEAALALQQLMQSQTKARTNQQVLQIQYSEKRGSLLNQIEQTKQTLSSVNGADTYSLLSPIDGIVRNIQVEKGERVNPGNFMMQISPLNREVKARMYIPSSHSGFIAINQVVGLKLSAFPYQKFGMASASIHEVSEDVLLPQQIKEVPFVLQGPVFIAEAALTSQTLSANGKQIHLKDGMLFEAEIELAEMQLWEWLLKPILSLRGTV